MRIFMNFGEAMEEIKRDLAEMGHTVHPKSVQNQIVEGNPDYDTKELTNYTYMVLNPAESLNELNPSQPWSDLEAQERFGNERLNPGEAWKSRPEIWGQYIDKETGKNDYTYPERFNPKRSIDAPDSNLSPMDKIAKELANNPDSRQCFLAIWDPQDIYNIGGYKRVPCSLGYQFQIREGKLNITYLQRSADFATHFDNDLYLAVRTAMEISQRIGDMTGTYYPIGSYTHWIGSLHIFKKDIKEVF